MFRVTRQIAAALALSSSLRTPAREDVGRVVAILQAPSIQRRSTQSNQLGTANDVLYAQVAMSSFFASTRRRTSAASDSLYSV